MPPTTGQRCCRVPGCTGDLLPGFQMKYRICSECFKAPVLDVEGMGTRRFCQQCGALHPLSDFHEQRRSCRKSLERHQERRRRHKEEQQQRCEQEEEVVEEWQRKKQQEQQQQQQKDEQPRRQPLAQQRKRVCLPLRGEDAQQRPHQRQRSASAGTSAAIGSRKELASSTGGLSVASERTVAADPGESGWQQPQQARKRWRACQGKSQQQPQQQAADEEREWPAADGGPASDFALGQPGTIDRLPLQCPFVLGLCILAEQQQQEEQGSREGPRQQQRNQQKQGQQQQQERPPLPPLLPYPLPQPKMQASPPLLVVQQEAVPSPLMTVHATVLPAVPQQLPDTIQQLQVVRQQEAPPVCPLAVRQLAPPPAPALPPLPPPWLAAQAAQAMEAALGLHPHLPPLIPLVAAQFPLLHREAAPLPLLPLLPGTQMAPMGAAADVAPWQALAAPSPGHPVPPSLVLQEVLGTPPASLVSPFDDGALLPLSTDLGAELSPAEFAAAPPFRGAPADSGPLWGC